MMGEGALVNGHPRYYPEEAMLVAKRTYNANVIWTGNKVQSVAIMNNHRLVIDEPVALGGDDEGPNPVQLLLASVGGCINIMIHMLAPRYEVELEEVETYVEGDLDPDGYRERAPVRPGLLEVRFAVKVVSPAPQEKVEALIAHAHRVCPVKDTLTGVPLVQMPWPEGEPA